MSNLALLGPESLAGLAALLGLIVGSFLNVVIHRLPLMMEREWRLQCAELQGQALPDEPALTLSTPRSRCPQCGHPVGVLENIPVISWLLLKGRCSGCNTRISVRYPVIELLTGFGTAYLAWRFGLTPELGFAVLFFWALLALTFIDADTQLLPDSITLPLLWLGLLANSFGLFTDLQSAVFGAMGGYLSLWSVYWLFRLATGKEGMGFGDFKLLAALGAWLGWQQLPVIILLSSVVGAITGIVLIIAAGRGRSVPIPFGPYLAAAGLIAMLWGKELTGLYLGLL